MAELDRVRWQCRRGMLELDLVLSRFLDQHYAGLTASEQAAFKSLLECSDNQLWDLIAGRQEPGSGDLEAIVGRLRQA